jgi:hypothetical protein
MAPCRQRSPRNRRGVDAELPGEGLEYLSDPDDDDSLPQ